MTNRHFFTFPLWCAAYGFAMVLLGARRLFAPNCDSAWHVAAGDLIRKLGHVPLADPFSFTGSAVPWVNPAWLYDVLLSVSIGLAGNLGGGVVLTAFLSAALMGLMAYHALQRGAAILPVLAALPMALLLIVPGIAMRPQMITLLGALLTAMLARQAGEKPHLLLALPPIGLLWANMHGGAVLGVAILGAFGLEALIARRFRELCYLALAAIGMGAAGMLTPYGMALFDMMQRTLSDGLVQRISEWQPPALTPLRWPFTLWLLLLLSTYRFRAPGMRLSDHLMVFGLLAAGLSSARHLPILAVLAAAPVALMLSHSLSAFPPQARWKSSLADLEARLRQRFSGRAGLRWLAAAILALGIATPLAVKQWDALLIPPQEYPVQEIDALATRYPHQRLFAFYGYGGLVIYRTRGALPVFFDSRAMNAYSPAVLEDAMRVQDVQDGFEKVLQRYGVTLLLFPKDHPIHAALAKSAEWRTVLEGPVAKAWVKN